MTKNEKFRALLKHGWDNSQFYREVYSEAGIRSSDLLEIGLEDLPVMEKSNLMVRFNEAVTDKRLKVEDLHPFIQEGRNPRELYLGEYVATGSSAGSDFPSYVPYTLSEWRYLTTEAAPALLPDTIQRERPVRSAFFFAREGHWVSSINASLASRRFHDVLYLGINQPVEEIWARLNDFQPERLTGYGSSIAWIVDWARNGKVKIAPDTVVISGDGLASFYREKIQEIWGSKIYDLYATVEAIFIALRKPGQEQFRVFDELVVLEVVDDHLRSVKPGERGRVLVTNLAQKTLPVIRFDLYDYATLGRSNFGAETLISLDGKSFDSLPIRISGGGVESIPPFELMQIKVPGVMRMQYHTHSPDHLEIWYISEEILDQEVESAVGTYLRGKNGKVDHIEVKRVDYLPSGKGTKFYNVMKPGKLSVELISVSTDPIPEQLVEKESGVEASLLGGAFPEKTVHGTFRRLADQYGDFAAVENQQRMMTYSQLDASSTKVAYRLLEHGLDVTNPVAIYISHQLDMVAMVLGVLKAGGFYIPVDTRLPIDRVIQILEDTKPEILLTTEELMGGISQFVNHGMDRITAESISQGTGSLKALPDVSTQAPACLIYTSGTTGVPLGIVLDHKAILNRANRYIVDYRINPGDKLSLLQSYAVNSGTRDIFGALLSGARLCMYDLLEDGIQGLPAWVQGKGITHLYMVPSLWRVFLEMVESEANHLEGYRDLSLIRLGGEAMIQNDWVGFKERMPIHCILANGYAATETGTICQYFMDHQADIPSGSIPVGFPVKGASIRVAAGDVADQANTLGELEVEADTLALGSWDPITKQVTPFQRGFFPTGDLGYRILDGRVYLVERKDRLVKVHGYRVSLEEIETAAAAIEGVNSAAAILGDQNREAPTVSLFYTNKPGFDILPKQVDEALRGKLPRQVIPTHIQRVEEIPRLLGGKVNLGALSGGEVDVLGPGHLEVAYQNETEEVLAGIWREVLQLGYVNRGDDFINLGGDSIMVFRVQNRIWEHFGVQISVREFFDVTQFSEMAEWILKKGKKIDGSDENQN